MLIHIDHPVRSFQRLMIRITSIPSRSGRYRLSRGRVAAIGALHGGGMLSGSLIVRFLQEAHENRTYVSSSTTLSRPDRVIDNSKLEQERKKNENGQPINYLFFLAQHQDELKR